MSLDLPARPETSDAWRRALAYWERRFKVSCLGFVLVFELISLAPPLLLGIFPIKVIVIVGVVLAAMGYPTTLAIWRSMANPDFPNLREIRLLQAAHLSEDQVIKIEIVKDEPQIAALLQTIRGSEVPLLGRDVEQLIDWANTREKNQKDQDAMRRLLA